MPNGLRELLASLLGATKPSEVDEILKELGDGGSVKVGDPFGSLDLAWRFYGDNESNMSTINIGSDPARGLVERITNAIDAVLDREMAQRGGKEPSSPQEAAKKWFGRPPSTMDSGVFTWKGFSTDGYDRQVNVVLLDGDEPESPTLDILDSGIGLKPDEFPDTILSLHKGNKIQKQYLSGAFGQGGSTTLSFSDYTLIVSRSSQEPDTIGFTAIKKMNLGETYKEDAYVYLVVEDATGNQIIPRVKLDGQLSVYPGLEVHSFLEDLEYGTVVRHYGYGLSGFESTLNPSPGNLYHLLHYLLFDPLLPFRVMDHRSGSSSKDELITGSRNRLMQLDRSSTAASGNGSSGSVLRHYSPIEMVSPLSDSEPDVGIEYWVVLNYRKVKDSISLRARSNDLYVDRHHPVIGTVNGQNHGELTSTLIKNRQLGMTSRHMVIHIDVSRASKRVRTQLLASTREGFKRGDAYKELLRILENRLEEDKVLYQIERELVDDLLKSESEDVDEEVRDQISRLLRDQGFEVKDPADVPGTGGDEDPTPTPPDPPSGEVEPLPTLPYPEVTHFEIVFPQDRLEIPMLDNKILRLETDASDRFYDEDRIAIRSEPPKLEVASKAPLKGGRMHWRLRAAEVAKEGDTGEVIASITLPDGNQLKAVLAYSIIPPKEASKKTKKGLVPPFKILPIDPLDDRPRFENVWPEVTEDNLHELAYRTIDSEGEIIVYYSTGFAPYMQQVEKLKSRTTLAEFYKKNYEIWIGYHAILQHQNRKKYEEEDSIDVDHLDSLLEQERALVATVQAKAAVRNADLQRKAAAEA